MGSGSGSLTETGSHANLFSSIQGNVNVQSTGGSNALIVVNQGETSGQTYTIAGSQVTATSSPATVDFSAPDSPP